MTWLRRYWPVLAFTAIWAIILIQPNAKAQTAPGGTPVVGGAQYKGTINSSVTIATGGTFQQVLASIIGATGTTGIANVRQSLTIENNNTSGDNCYLYVGSSTATKAISILLIEGGSYSRYWPYVPPDEIQATCDNTSDTLYIDTQ
jgi:hypothetical protein